MKRSTFALHFLLVVFVLMAAASPAAAKGGGYQTDFVSWRALDGGFAAWTTNGVSLTGAGNLQLNPDSAASGSDPYEPGSYYGGNFYNGGSFLVGEAVSPEIPVTFNFREAVASWNAITPAGTWVETQIRAGFGGRWSKWYNLGIWAQDDSTIRRHSVRLQGDSDGYVAVDTLVLTNSKAVAQAFQVKLRLFSTDGSNLPAVSSVSVASSTAAPKKAAVSTGNPALWNTLLSVPECSQMVYPDGGNVWCSPTSTSMVLGYWGIDPGPCEPRVRAAVAGVYDWIYGGHGNWPFNTAYAAARGMDAYVARFTGLDQVEPWVAAGIPVVASIAWKKGELTGAPVKSSGGHLVVIVGFDSSGNPIVNDPAAPADADVQRTYLRGEFEQVWLTNSGGTVYLIYPMGQGISIIQ